MNGLKKLLAVCLATTITTATSLTAFASTDAVIKKIDALMGFSYGTMYALNDALKTDFLINKYNEVKSSVTDVINDTYKAESSWWNEYLALPIYFGVLSGYEDGTLKPSQSVKASEMAKIVATAYEPIIKEVDGLNNADFNGQWYNKYYNAVARAFTYPQSTLMTPEYMNSNMRRCEVAYVLASVCNDGTLKDYIAKAESGDLSQMAGYTDFVNVVKTDVDMDIEQARMNAGELPARFAGAIMYLQAKGIMVGDGAGHINPLDNVTRAEVFKLIQTTCQNTASYTKNKFYGWEKKSNSSSYTEQQPEQTQMTEETVLNPNAPAELQYKVGDFRKADVPYIINGKQNIAELTMNEEYCERVSRMVIDSIQINGDKITFNLPDLKSDYHEIRVVNQVYGMGGSTERFLSSRQNGTITIDKKAGAYIMVEVVGREDKGRPASGSLFLDYEVDTGNVVEYH